MQLTKNSCICSLHALISKFDLNGVECWFLEGDEVRNRSLLSLGDGVAGGGVRFGESESEALVWLVFRIF